MDKILIGTVLKPQGLKGELKCKLLNNDYSVIEKVTEIYFNNKEVPTKIQNKVFRGGYLYLTIKSIDSRDKADLMRNFNIYSERTNIVVPEDNYIISDLIGSQVVDQNGESIGVLKDVENYGASDILIIYANARDYMVPFIKSIFVKVNATAKLLVVDKKKYNEAKICE